MQIGYFIADATDDEMKTHDMWFCKCWQDDLIKGSLYSKVQYSTVQYLPQTRHCTVDCNSCPNGSSEQDTTQNSTWSHTNIQLKHFISLSTVNKSQYVMFTIIVNIVPNCSMEKKSPAHPRTPPLLYPSIPPLIGLPMMIAAWNQNDHKMKF